ncbi:MAG TPA: trypsin-like peptidase domain-containing protein [Candidatus Binatia bacterium]|nr:trypsin-like peptidase domain-containing protein [Candidatus Binatia bacterium]
MDKPTEDNSKETTLKAEPSKQPRHQSSSLEEISRHYVPPHIAYPDRVRQLSVVFLLLISLSAGFLGGWLGADTQHNSLGDTNLITSKSQPIITSETQAITNIAKNVGQSVVSIDATSQSAGTPYADVFGSGGSQTSEDAGTGIILSSNGLIITNRHVIPDGTTSVSVTLSDGTTYNNVQVVGRTSDNSSLDIAFLKISNTNGKQLVPATIGDSSKMAVGDPVVAIGNALGQFQNTVTSGIISGYGRSIQASDSTGTSTENLDDLFQTDAAINEGNSGGPLVDLNGQVIGINTAIASDSQNIGFAIPIDDVLGLIKSVETTGKLQQPYLGVLFIPITSDVAQQYSLATTSGAWVPPNSVSGQTSVVAGGPAASAGVQAGDIITAINGQAINQNTSLTSVIDQEAPGDQASLTINRGGKTITINVTLGTYPADGSSN